MESDTSGLAKTASSRASSSAALARNLRACSSCFIEHFAIGGGFEEHVARRVAPVIELGAGDGEQVHRHDKALEHAPQPDGFGGRVFDFVLKEHEVQVAVFAGVTARVGAEEDDAAKVGGVHEAADGVAEFLRGHGPEWCGGGGGHGKSEVRRTDDE